jgi:hypothetical protein
MRTARRILLLLVLTRAMAGCGESASPVLNVLNDTAEESLVLGEPFPSEFRSGQHIRGSPPSDGRPQDTNRDRSSNTFARAGGLRGSRLANGSIRASAIVGSATNSTTHRSSTGHNGHRAAGRFDAGRCMGNYHRH